MTTTPTVPSLGPMKPRQRQKKRPEDSSDSINQLIREFDAEMERFDRLLIEAYKLINPKPVTITEMEQFDHLLIEANKLVSPIRKKTNGIYWPMFFLILAGLSSLVIR